MDYLAEHASRLASASVDDVAAVASRYLAPAGAVVVILGDAAKIESGLATLGSVVRASVD
jgi:predicted Zn-dependent peptidase